MRCFSLTLYTILLLMLPLMANAQKTGEPDVIMTDSSIQILDPVSQVPDSLKREKAKVGLVILDEFAKKKKIDIDYKKVEEYVTQNAEGYEQLLNRFQEDPASLSVEEAAMLYYGFAFTKDYMPENIDMNVKLMEAFHNKNFGALKKESRRTPVSLSLLMNMAFLADEMGNEESKQKYRLMSLKLLNGIMASGTGYSKEKAIKVLYIADEYAIFRDLMGLRLTVQDFEDRRYDRMTLETGNGGESIILWFDTYLNHQKILNDHNKKKNKK